MKTFLRIIFFLGCPLLQAAGNSKEVALLTRLEQLAGGIEFGNSQFGQFEAKMKELEPEIYFSRQLQKKVSAMSPSPTEIGFITLDDIIGENLPITIAQDRIETIYQEFYESSDDFEAILIHAKNIVTHADQLINQLDTLSARLAHNAGKQLVNNDVKKAEAKVDDLEKEKDRKEKIKQSFVDTLKNWLHSFININESFINYACAIVFPLLIQLMYEISHENTIPMIGLCAGATFIVREQLLEQKIHKIAFSALISAGVLALAAQNYGLLAMGTS